MFGQKYSRSIYRNYNPIITEDRRGASNSMIVAGTQKPRKARKKLIFQKVWDELKKVYLDFLQKAWNGPIKVYLDFLKHLPK
jgi:hypothetical protein